MHKTTRLLPARFQAGELFYIGFLFLAGLLLQTAALFFSSLIAYLRITGKPQFGQGQSFVSVPHLGQVIFLPPFRIYEILISALLPPNLSFLTMI